MIITCEACGTSFKIKSSLIKDFGSTVRCSKCQHLFIAYPPSLEAGDPDLFSADDIIESSIESALDREFAEEFESDLSPEEDLDKKTEKFEFEDTESEDESDVIMLSEEALVKEAEFEKETISSDDEEFELDLIEATDKSAAGVEAVENEDLEFEQELNTLLDLEEEKTTETLPDEGDTLEFDLEDEEAASENESALEEQGETDLDLDFELDEFEDLEFTEEATAEPTAELSEEKSADEDFDLDLDLEAEDLTLADKEMSEDIDLDLDLESEEEALTLDSSEDLELDFDLEAEASTVAGSEATEDFELDLEIEPEEEESESADFELDLEEVKPEAATMGESESEMDFSLEEETAATDKTRTEEVDLSDIEGFLDLEEVSAEEKTVEPETVSEKDLVDFTVEPEYTGAASEGDELDIDLETMLDEEEEVEFADEKEVALEPIDEQDRRLEEEEADTRRRAPEPASREEFVEEPEAGVEMPAAAVSLPEAAPAPPSREHRINPILVALLILVVMAALIYGGYELFSGKEAETPGDAGNLRIEMIADPAYVFVENDTAGELLVVTGTVTNQYDHPRSSIQVKGTLYDSAGKAIGTSTAYAGNMVADSELKTLDLADIKARLADREGDRRQNVGVKPGEQVPFTVVFDKVPAAAEEFTVEVVRSTR